MVKRIIDRFTPLAKPQYRYQMRHHTKGLCVECQRPVYRERSDWYCDVHLDKRRQRRKGLSQ